MSKLEKEQAELEQRSSDATVENEDAADAGLKIETPDESANAITDEDDTKSTKKKSKLNPVLAEIFSWIKIFVGAFVVAYILTQFVIVNARIPSGSMISTINEGDKVIGFRLSYMFEEPKRGEIVMFNSPVEEGKIYIKRIIGLPGDTIDIKNNQTYVNGELLEEDYVRNGWVNSPGHTVYKVPEGCYFMMGDNRDGSSDSRMWGFVEGKEIIAKAIFRYYPSIEMLK